MEETGPIMVSDGSAHELVKREVGENPTRSRRCNRGVLAICHWETGKAVRVMILEPEYLPVFLHRNSTMDRKVFISAGFRLTLLTYAIKPLNDSC